MPQLLISLNALIRRSVSRSIFGNSIGAPASEGHSREILLRPRAVKNPGGKDLSEI